MRLALILLILLGGLTVAALRLVPMEYEAASARDPRVLLGLPSVIRHLDLPESCGAPRFSQRFLDCGGVCGRRISLAFAARALPDPARIRAATGASEVTLTESGPGRPETGGPTGPETGGEADGGAPCRDLVLDLTFDERPAP